MTGDDVALPSSGCQTVFVFVDFVELMGTDVIIKLRKPVGLIRDAHKRGFTEQSDKDEAKETAEEKLYVGHREIGILLEIDYYTN